MMVKFFFFFSFFVAVVSYRSVFLAFGFLLTLYMEEILIFLPTLIVIVRIRALSRCTVERAEGCYLCEQIRDGRHCS